MITIKNLSKTYRTKKQNITAVDQLNLTIDSGEIFGVIGYSGAGKSTFVRLLNRLEEPTAGEIIINGKDIVKQRKNELRLARQEIGMIFQHFNLLWSRTVHQNIAFPLEIAGVPKKERKAKVDRLIELVGLKGRENAYPSQLSGGQKQRVGIARALANDPKVLLCDEATSALDPETTDSILDLLVDINKRLGLTIVLITHEMNVIRKICHRVAVMDTGKVVEQGDAAHVFQNPQKEITKRFVQQLDGSEQYDSLSAAVVKEGTGTIVKLSFSGENVNQTVVSQTAKKFDVDINILQGNVLQTQTGAVGNLFLQLVGSETEVEKALDFIRAANVRAEVQELV
ncbi:methionine ABC transporter ATP-binding protein [Terribacillus saccharophilus]|uniref:methionine ABC transporter ATP-binding protein n=1 Tax=Terribacillus saccharophilus TaxID=361277 RepID=UPI0039829001